MPEFDKNSQEPKTQTDSEHRLPPGSPPTPPTLTATAMFDDGPSDDQGRTQKQRQPAQIAATVGKLGGGDQSRTSADALQLELKRSRLPRRPLGST